MGKQIRCDDIWHDNLMAYCNATGRKLTWCVNEAIKEYLERLNAVDEQAKLEANK